MLIYRTNPSDIDFLNISRIGVAEKNGKIVILRLVTS
jgi:hypothetical protein